MLIRVVVAAVLAVGFLTACERYEDDPKTTRTLEPALTESSPEPTTAPDNRACKLLSANEREAVPGFTMNDVVPVVQQAGTNECVWVHSRRENVRSAIRLVALSAREWAPSALANVNRAIASPTTLQSNRVKLRAARAELIKGALTLPPERICEIYLLSFEGERKFRISDLTYYGTIGALTAAYAVSCRDGIMIIAGYGELGLRPSLAVQHAVAKLAGLAARRAPRYFDTGSDGSPGPTDEPTESTEPSDGESPAPSTAPSRAPASDTDSDTDS